MSQTGGTFDCNTMFGFLPGRTTDISLEKLLAVMAANGVERALSLSTRGVLHDGRAGNDLTVEAARAHAQIVPAATLKPTTMVDFDDEIRRMLDCGVRVFRFFPDRQGWPTRYLPFMRCVEQLRAHRAIVMLPMRGTGSCTDLIEVTRAPGLPVILTGASYSTLGEVIVAMQLKPDLYVETRLISGPDCFDVLRREVGLSRALFGSGAPLEYQTSALRLVTESTMSDQEKRAVLGGNLARLLEEGAQ